MTAEIEFVLKWTASQKWEQVQDLNWTTSELCEVLRAYAQDENKALKKENSSMLKAHNEFVNVAEDRIQKLQSEVEQLRGLAWKAIDVGNRMEMSAEILELLSYLNKIVYSEKE